MFKMFSKVLLVAGLLIGGTTAAFSATTPWMNASALRNYVASNMGKAIYATKIECRLKDGKLEARFHTKPVGASKPFYKWQFVIVKPNQYQAAVNKLPRTDRKDLVYKAVSKSTVGNEAVCAVLYR